MLHHRGTPKAAYTENPFFFVGVMANVFKFRKHLQMKNSSPDICNYCIYYVAWAAWDEGEQTLFQMVSSLYWNRVLT